MELFRGFYARRKGEFVIESDSTPPPFDAPYGTYRCQDHMRALLGRLRSKGVVSKTPLHSLRKEFGSLIHARYGLLAASEQLRHGDIGVTARHYLENRQPSAALRIGFRASARNIEETSRRLLVEAIFQWVTTALPPGAIFLSLDLAWSEALASLGSKPYSILKKSGSTSLLKSCGSAPNSGRNWSPVALSSSEIVT